MIAETQPLRDELVMMQEEMEELKGSIAYLQFKCEKATIPEDRARYEQQLLESTAVVKDLETTCNRIMAKLDSIDVEQDSESGLQKTNNYITEPKVEEQDDPELDEMKTGKYLMMR